MESFSIPAYSAYEANQRTLKTFGTGEQPRLVAVFHSSGDVTKAFLFGLSMDYEVFMLTRVRDADNEAGDTKHAVALGLARTGKLVTSAALVLMFAFFVFSTGPGVDIKQFGIGLAAGIIFDATVIRGLLVPALMRLLGRWNWWLPAPAPRALFVRRPEGAADRPATEPA